MPKIELNKIPKLVTDKYSVKDNTFKLNKVVNSELDSYKGEPKDEIKITLGDENALEFIPNVELKRWNEVSFKVKPRLLDVLSKDKSLKFEGEKVKFDTPKISFEMYDYTENEGGYKFIWYLNEKPATNKVEFDIESSGLDFFYQPELTQEEIDNGAVRPENVVGSYAVYHSTKGGMNDAYGKDYKTGKAFHIYRPRIIDAEGKETWGILKIENGIYSEEIPQEFLDKAVYPIRSNATFGFTGIGGTLTETATDRMDGIVATGGAGMITSISWYNVLGTYDDGPQKLGLYKASDSTFVIGTADVSNQATDQFVAVNVTSSTEITAQDYVILHWGEEVSMCYDTVTGIRRFQIIGYPAAWPSPATFATGDYKLSIYATYTPAGGGETESDVAAVKSNLSYMGVG